MRDTLVKLGRYALTAGTAAIVDAGGFALLHHAGLATLPAAIASFLVATVFNYALTARFVFHQRASARGYLVFLAAALLGATVNVGVTVAAERLLGLSAVLAKLTGIGAAFGVNFLLNLRFVFRRKKSVA